MGKHFKAGKLELLNAGGGRPSLDDFVYQCSRLSEKISTALNCKTTTCCRESLYQFFGSCK